MHPLRYYPISEYYRHIFGRPVQKAVIDGGFTCPNMDGTVSRGGCLFCSDGSGHFTHPGTITEQLSAEAQRIHAVQPSAGLIAYFQAHTNTYGSPELLEQRYGQALRFPDVCGLSIATRPDCLPEPVLALLERLSHETHLTVELGLQTIHDKTAAVINRGYPFETFLLALNALQQRHIRVCVHLINGLPGEDEQDMLETARVLGKLRPDGVKLHLLHVLRNTPLEQLWRQGGLQLLSIGEYVQITAAQLSLLPAETVIERLTGDGDTENLLAPLWSLDKQHVRNAITQHLKRTNCRQGCFFTP